MLRNADELLLPAVKATIAALPDKTDRYAAQIKLCEAYARTIDEAPDAKRYYAIRDVGPLLQAGLEAMGATPISHPKLKEGRPTGGSSRLAAIRSQVS